MMKLIFKKLYVFSTVEKKAKVFLEDYSNASAGVLVTQPIGLVRYTGV